MLKRRGKKENILLYLLVGHASSTVTSFHVVFLLQPPSINEVVRMVIRGADLETDVVVSCRIAMHHHLRGIPG